MIGTNKIKFGLICLLMPFIVGFLQLITPFIDGHSNVWLSKKPPLINKQYFQVSSAVLTSKNIPAVVKIFTIKSLLTVSRNSSNPQKNQVISSIADITYNEKINAMV